MDLILFEHFQESINFKPDILLLLKKFLIHSISEKIIIKVCTILEKVKELDPNIVFDHHFEESKNKIFIKSSKVSK